ncbi:Protein of unknown function [Gryllus bimaculatus]|nr:Protein of unknown function [Gryllus bimaculatus]
MYVCIYKIIRLAYLIEKVLFDIIKRGKNNRGSSHKHKKKKLKCVQYSVSKESYKNKCNNGEHSCTFPAENIKDDGQKQALYDVNGLVSMSQITCVKSLHYIIKFAINISFVFFTEAVVNKILLDLRQSVIGNFTLLKLLKVYV